MSCKHPCVVQREFFKHSGEMVSKFLGSAEKVSKLPLYADFFRSNYDGTKLSAYNLETPQRLVNLCLIPCGKCIGCRIDYSRSWADRMTYHKMSRAEDPAWFITLTYNDEVLEKLDSSPDYGIASLCYDDASKFIKAVRNKWRDCQIDYYYSGEYGDSSFRAHFHFIIYGFDIPDLEFWKLNGLGDPIYKSKILDGLWSKGIVAVEEFTWNTAAYAARYVIKKRDGRQLCEYEAVGIEPEKCRMSRRPGIAYDFYQDHWRDLWANDGMNVSRSVNASGKLGLSRYFLKLASKSNNPEQLEAVQAFQERSVQRSNVINPYKVYNSSFDFDNVQKLLDFQERELLRKNSQRSF